VANESKVEQALSTAEGTLARLQAAEHASLRARAALAPGAAALALPAGQTLAQFLDAACRERVRAASAHADAVRALDAALGIAVLPSARERAKLQHVG
jgi:hypothetical protein